MSALAGGQAEWWHPTILGQPLVNPAQLPYWLGAWAIQWLPLDAETAARVPFIMALFATLYLVWHAVYRFALLPSAQPVAFAFGGEANPVDYARSLADGGLLALLASLGLAQLSHETTPAVFQLLATAALLKALAHFVTSPMVKLEPSIGLLWLSALLMLGLSGAPELAAALAWVPLLMQSPQRLIRFDPVRVLVAVLGLAMASALWWGLDAPRLWEDLDSVNSGSRIYTFGKLVFWFAWPVWPLAIWTLWRWRQHISTPHLQGPLWLTAILVGASAMSPNPDRALLLALPVLSLLAAFALPTLKRSVAALIDWFSVLFFSVCAFTVWVIWWAMLTGSPAKPAANVARLAPGFTLEFSFLAFAVATFGSVGWLWAVRWRLGRHPVALWKSLVLAASGGTLCWLLLMTLWMPLLDFARSYAPISRRIANMLPSTGCTEVFGLTQAQMTGLTHHGKLKLQRAPSLESCEALVVSPQALERLGQEVDLTQWAFKARLSRLTDNKESLLLYQRIAPPALPGNN